MNTLWEKIIIYLKNQNEWTNGGTIERESINWIIKGKIVKPSIAGRRARDLAEVGIIDHKEEGSVYYRFLSCPEIKEKAKALMLDDKKQRFQARMYWFVKRITMTEEEIGQAHAMGIAI